MIQLIFASHNENKTTEIRAMLPSDVQLISLNELNYFDEIEETESTLEGNSLLKAKTIFEHFQLPCFADDSGLEIDFLYGKPGVFSARYAGEPKNDQENIKKVLDELKDTEERQARFRTVITLVAKNQINAFEGSIQGSITKSQKGTDGFGYDPIFQPEHQTVTFAEMTKSEKNNLSHRTLALQKMISFLTLNKITLQ